MPKPGPVTREDVRAAVERALTRMRSKRIDLLQFHAWNYADPSWLDALFYLDELRAEGLIGHLGLTNFDTAHLRIAVASGIPILTNQVSFSLLDQRAAGAMSAYCREHGRAAAGLRHRGGRMALRRSGSASRSPIGSGPAPGRR